MRNTLSNTEMTSPIKRITTSTTKAIIAVLSEASSLTAAEVSSSTVSVTKVAGIDIIITC